MKTLDPMLMGRLMTQLHLVDAAQTALQDASLALQAAMNAKGLDGLCKALCDPADGPVAPLMAALTEYSNLDIPSRARRQINAISASSDANEALDALHLFTGYLYALFEEKLLDSAEHDLLLARASRRGVIGSRLRVPSTRIKPRVIRHELNRKEYHPWTRQK